LTGLWLTEDFVENFHDYLNQLSGTIEQVFTLDAQSLRAAPGAREEVIKIFYILRGIMRGLITNKQFNLFFDWFYP
jgi:hypothetical protein